MKTILSCIVLLVTITTSAQSLVFKNATLKSGHELKKGAVYTFKNIISGINAEVTITDLVNGATINKIDDNSDGVGYTDAFQPEIESGNKGESYAVFTVKLIEKSTSSPYLLKSLKATALDIDGTSGLKEFDEINMAGGTAAYMGGTLQISLNSLPIIGTLFKKFRADNTTGIDKNGIDTSSKGNMYTVTNSNVNSFTLKLGSTTTTSSNIARQYSIYMMGFQYPNLVMLPLKLLSFTAAATGTKGLLNWTTTAEHDLSSFIVERSDDGSNFASIGTVTPNGSFTEVTAYSFTDHAAISGVTYYRLRCMNDDGSFLYSNIQAVKASGISSPSVSAFPNPFTATLTINYPSSLRGKQVATEIFNSNGQLIKTKTASVGSMETIETSSLQRGIYIIRVTAGTEKMQYKVIKS